jgi:VanZ family protein
MTGASFWGSFYSTLYSLTCFTYYCKIFVLKNYRNALATAVVWLLVVTTLLCIPGTKLPKISWQNKIWLDKWVHIGLFLILVFLWCWAYSKRKELSKKLFINVTILFIVYGIAMEIVQHYFIPFRLFDVGDIIADAAGAIAGYFISVKRFSIDKTI